MKIVAMVTAGIFLCSLAVIAGGQLNVNKIDWRLIEGAEISKGAVPTIHSPLLSKSTLPNQKLSVIVHATSIDDAKSLGIETRSFNGKLFTASITSEQLLNLSNSSTVSFIEVPKILYPRLDKSLVEMKVDKLHAGQINSTVYKGSGVIVGIIDTGIDWKHLDFRSDADTTKTRILFLWDQLDSRPSIGPASYNYGAEYDQNEINNELDGTPANFVQETDSEGHGTHVASIAAGDGSTSNGKYKGVAPEADLIIVKAGDGTFSSDKVIDGITYIREKAVALGKPYVINLSLGGHDGSHDGSDGEEITIDSELSDGIGRQIVIAAGNEREDSIHAGASVAQGGQSVIKFVIPSYTATGGTNNDYVYMSMWYKGGDNLTVAVTTPNNTTTTATSGQQKTASTAQGFVQILNASPGVISNSIKKGCEITLVDFSGAPAPVAGEWTITISGASVTQGGPFDIWIASSSMTGNNGDAVKFTTGVTSEKLVGMPGTANSGITVGSYVTKWSWASVDGHTYLYNGNDRTNNFSKFSSPGPTRDNRQKPDVSAPGQAIAAALSSSSSVTTQLQVTPAGKYVIEQGTSMAAPHVAGLVALMLQAQPTLSSAQIRTALINTARTDANVGSVPSPQWGYGKVDAEAVLNAVLSVKRESSSIPDKFQLSQNYPNPFNPITRIKFSVPIKNNVTLKVFSTLGTEVATLLNEELLPGEYSVPFDASNFASGVYFYSMYSNGVILTKKMILLK